MRIESFSNIGTNTCSGANQLIRQNRLLLIPLYFVAHFYDSQGKRLGFIYQRTSHTIAPFVPYIFTIHYYLLLPKNPECVFSEE